MRPKRTLSRWWIKLLLFFSVVGPGFITANVDNDAGGIFTYSQAGAQFGYSLLWTGLHRSMHEVGGRWALHLPGYAALRAHHLDHHRHAGRNFGTVFGSAVQWGSALAVAQTPNWNGCGVGAKLRARSGLKPS